MQIERQFYKLEWNKWNNFSDKRTIKIVFGDQSQVSHRQVRVVLRFKVYKEREYHVHDKNTL